MEKEKIKFHVTDQRSCQNDKCYEVVESNLPADHKRMHTFTKVASGEKENQISCH